MKKLLGAILGLALFAPIVGAEQPLKSAVYNIGTSTIAFVSGNVDLYQILVTNVNDNSLISVMRSSATEDQSGEGSGGVTRTTIAFVGVSSGTTQIDLSGSPIRVDTVLIASSTAADTYTTFLYKDVLR